MKRPCASGTWRPANVLSLRVLKPREISTHPDWLRLQWASKRLRCCSIHPILSLSCHLSRSTAAADLLHPRSLPAHTRPNSCVRWLFARIGRSSSPRCARSCLGIRSPVANSHQETRASWPRACGPRESANTRHSSSSKLWRFDRKMHSPPRFVWSTSALICRSCGPQVYARTSPPTIAKFGFGSFGPMRRWQVETATHSNSTRRCCRRLSPSTQIG